MRSAAIARTAANGNGLIAAKPIRYTILDEYILTNASQAVRFSTSGSSNTAVVSTVVANPVDSPAGQASNIHIVSAGYNGSNIGIVLPTTWDMTTGFFRYSVKCEAIYSKVRGFTIRFAQSKAQYTAGNYYVYTISSGNSASWLVQQTWVFDSFDPNSPSQMQTRGTPTGLDTIGYVVLSMSDAGVSVTNNWDFGTFQHIQSVGTKAKLVIWHDDFPVAPANTIRTKLDAYGWGGTEAGYPGAVNVSGAYTTADLALFKAHGWQIATHANTGQGHYDLPATNVANQWYHNKLDSNRWGIGGDSADFAYWGSLQPVLAYPIIKRLARSGRWFVNGLVIPETQPAGDPFFMKAMGTGSSDTFEGTWKPLLQNAITMKGIAQIVYHQQLTSDATQAAEFDKMLVWLDANRASIDVVNIAQALAESL